MKSLLTDCKYPDNIGVIHNDTEIPYSVLIQKAQVLESVLAAAGRGNIAIFLPNGGDYIAAFWGALATEAMVMPINTLLTAAEIAPLLKQAHVGTVVTTTAHCAMLEAVAAEADISFNTIYIEELAPHPIHKALSAKLGREATVLLSTSGTTGESKIVQLSEKNIMASVLGYLAKVRHGGASVKTARYYPCIPFCSAYGIMILSACLMESIPIVIPESSFMLNDMYRAAEKHKITHYEGSASAIELMLRTAGRTIPYDISTLKYFGFGGSKISETTVKSFLKAYPGIAAYQGYGMTEAAPLITKHPTGRLEKTGSVGNAIENVEIAVETEAGITTAPFVRGEILVQGPNVMQGYYKNSAETEKTLKDGYLHTGDIGFLDEDGYLYICGRKKNVVIIRGFNVYPEEVEACIQNSGLTTACHVYGGTDESGSEIIYARAVPASPEVTEEAVRRYCYANLAPYKWPKEIMFCDTIETTLSGKIRHSREAVQ